MGKNSGAGKKAARESRDRARRYQARQEFHASLSGRRRRDNLIAGLGGGLLILAVIGGQVAYYTVGPGTPAPAPTETSTPSPSVSLSPAATDPVPTETVTSTPTP